MATVMSKGTVEDAIRAQDALGELRLYAEALKQAEKDAKDVSATYSMLRWTLRAAMQAKFEQALFWMSAAGLGKTSGYRSLCSAFDEETPPAEALLDAINWAVEVARYWPDMCFGEEG